MLTAVAKHGWCRPSPQCDSESTSTCQHSGDCSCDALQRVIGVRVYSECVGHWICDCGAGAGSFGLRIKDRDAFELQRTDETGAVSLFTGTFAILEGADRVVFKIDTVEPELVNVPASEGGLQVGVRCKVKSDWDAKVWKMKLMWPRLDTPEGVAKAQVVPDWPPHGAKLEAESGWRCLEFRKRHTSGGLLKKITKCCCC